jgi:hypothetical protein
MATLLLNLLPVLSIVGAGAYAALTGLRMNRAGGQVCALAVAVAIAGLALGRLMDRFSRLPGFLNDWVNYRGDANDLASTGSDRLLSVLSVEAALLFVLAAVVALIAVLLIRRDAAIEAGPRARSRGRRLIAALFVATVAITFRSKLAVFIAFAMAKGHLL